MTNQQKQKKKAEKIKNILPVLTETKKQDLKVIDQLEKEIKDLEAEIAMHEQVLKTKFEQGKENPRYVSETLTYEEVFEIDNGHRIKMINNYYGEISDKKNRINYIQNNGIIEN